MVEPTSHRDQMLALLKDQRVQEGLAKLFDEERKKDKKYYFRKYVTIAIIATIITGSVVFFFYYLDNNSSKVYRYESPSSSPTTQNPSPK